MCMEGEAMSTRLSRESLIWMGVSPSFHCGEYTLSTAWCLESFSTVNTNGLNFLMLTMRKIIPNSGSAVRVEGA